MKPLHVLQDPRFGAWLSKRIRPPGSGIALHLDIACEWPARGSILDVCAALTNSATVVSLVDVAELFGLAQEYALSLHARAAPPGREDAL